MIRLRGVVSELYPIFAGYIAGELSFTGTLLGRTSPSIECRIQCFDYRASLARRSSHASRGEALLIVLLLSVSFARRGVKD